MTDFIATPTETLLSMDASVRATINSPAFSSTEIFKNLHPIRLTRVELDEYRTRLGWPVEVPVVDSITKTLASVQGVVLSQRPMPYEIDTGAVVRWVAGRNYYDRYLGSWTPISGDHMDYIWKTNSDFAPILMPKMSYFMGKELITRDGINFDADAQQHFWSDFRGGMAGVVNGYTVVMAVMLNSAMGNTPGRNFMGIWGPGNVPEGPEDWIETDEGFGVNLEGNKLVIDSESVQNSDGLKATDLLSSSSVVYVAFSLSYPVSTIWGSTGAGTTTFFNTMVGNDMRTQQLQVVLGRSNGSLKHTADMSLMDIGIYEGALGYEDIEREFSILAQSYGG